MFDIRNTGKNVAWVYFRCIYFVICCVVSIVQSIDQAFGWNSPSNDGRYGDRSWSFSMFHDGLIFARDLNSHYLHVIGVNSSIQ